MKLSERPGSGGKYSKCRCWNFKPECRTLVLVLPHWFERLVSGRHARRAVHIRQLSRKLTFRKLTRLSTFPLQRARAHEIASHKHTETALGGERTTQPHQPVSIFGVKLVVNRIKVQFIRNIRPKLSKLELCMAMVGPFQKSKGLSCTVRPSSLKVAVRRMM